VFDSKTVVLFLYVFSTSLPLRSEGMTCWPQFGLLSGVGSVSCPAWGQLQLS
jgi:hypothetical protein